MCSMSSDRAKVQDDSLFRTGDPDAKGRAARMRYEHQRKTAACITKVPTCRSTSPCAAAGSSPVIRELIVDMPSLQAVPLDQALRDHKRSAAEREGCSREEREELERASTSASCAGWARPRARVLVEPRQVGRPPGYCKPIVPAHRDTATQATSSDSTTLRIRTACFAAQHHECVERAQD